jgi:outer membrane protein
VTRWRLSASAAILGIGYGVVSASAQTPERLTLKEAEARAVQQSPQIRGAQYQAKAAEQAVREARAAFFPALSGSLTGAQAQSGTRIAAGGLNNPIILDRLAYGFSASQLLTDFGRTSALTASAALRSESQTEDVDARRASVLLDVDRAYFDALRARAVLRVAEETAAARQVVVDQISALAGAGLKSSLDVSFAQVNLSQAQLLLVQARNDVQAADTGLAAAMGVAATPSYDLVEEPAPVAPPSNADPLIAAALSDRPDVARERLSEQAAVRFADAERALFLPSISFVGAAGATPYHQAGLTDRYSALGLNVTVPLTNGHLFAGRSAEAAFHANAAEQSVKDLENRVTRDVTLAWLSALTAFQRLTLTAQLLTQATTTLDLAQQRYTLGLSSIVELTQAQLNQTEAEIQQATARYEYQARHAALLYETGQLR